MGPEILLAAVVGYALGYACAWHRAHHVNAVEILEAYHQMLKEEGK
jgi:hypothetical protein